MKECLSCHRQVDDLIHACPHCGGTMFVQEAISGLEALAKQAQAAEYVNRGAQLLINGQPVRAEQEFRQAIEINPMNATAHGNLGDSYLRRGRYQEAIPWLEKALELNPQIQGVAEALERARKAARWQPYEAAVARRMKIGAWLGALLVGPLSLVVAWFQPIDGVPGYQLITREDWSIVFGFAFALLVGAMVGAMIGAWVGARAGRKAAAHLKPRA